MQDGCPTSEHENEVNLSTDIKETKQLMQKSKLEETECFLYFAR